MKSVGSFYAKTHFAQLLEEINKGEKIIITKHGKSIAMLSPLEEDISENKVKIALKKMQEIRKKIRKKTTLADILKMKEEGRK